MLQPFPITGKVFASNGTTDFPDAVVTLRNTTKESSESTTTETDGSFAFDLNNFVGGYADGDSLKIEARIGSFYKTETITVDTGVPGIDQSLTLAAEEANEIIDFYRLKEEIVIFLRQKLTDPESRGSTKTNTQSGTGSKVKFEFPDTTVKFVDYILVDNELKTNYTDYYVEYNDKLSMTNPVVYFLSPPDDGDLVEIKYSYGQTWVYPDVPRNDLSINSYPRVNVNFIGVRPVEGGLHADSNITDILGSIMVRSTSESDLNTIVEDSRTLIMQNKKNFHYFKLMIPGATGPSTPVPNREFKVLQQTQDFMIKYRLEKI